MFDDLATLATLLSRRGFVVKEIWGEKPMAPARTARAVNRNRRKWRRGRHRIRAESIALERELDIHVLHVDEHGCPIPAWNGTVLFRPMPSQDVAGSQVRQFTAWQLCICVRILATSFRIKTFRICGA